MELLLWVVRSPARVFGFLTMALAIALGFSVMETRILRAKLSAKPETRVLESVKTVEGPTVITERITEKKTVTGEIVTDTERRIERQASETTRLSESEIKTAVFKPNRFVGFGYWPKEYLEIYGGIDLGRFQLAAGVYRANAIIGPKLQIGYRF